MGVDLPLIWAAIILFGVMMYVVMDGFDLGIGLLLPFIGAKADRDIMVNTVAPVWDGNETWLVLGGAGLFVAFPVAYAVVLSAFHLPLVLMLVGLILRGVAFEFRFKAPEAQRAPWDVAFSAGSLLATFFQGVTLGGFVQGVEVRNGEFAGPPLFWLAPFPVFVGLGLVVAYATLGGTWLVMKTGGDLQCRMRVLARRLCLGLLAAIVGISVWTPLAQPHIAERWFSFPNLFWFAPVPALVLACTLQLRRTLADYLSEVAPFCLTLALIFLGYSGLAISLWPNVIPPSVSIREAAGPPQSLGFTLVGALLILPVILGYTAWGYWVFRGKVRGDEGYH
jgi:cytochrome d ubiquinol oxidase subunit II